jgi:hypothetical protein
MAVTVFVWPKRGNYVGHVSLLVGTQYISFWPVDEAGKKDVTLKRSHEPSFMPGYEDDCRAEGGLEARQLTLWSLDEAAMSEARDELMKAGYRYNLLKMNCSSFAAALLEVGSRRKPSFVPAMDPKQYLARTQMGRKVGRSVVFACGPLCVWTPEQLLRYAEELEHGAAVS